ncbi:MAG TPA: Stp1/IreP family PP2C-type Ser/Thr phosphatase [Candidatus Saccharimonadales bacterium]|jgi:serine/threonine protein phosphatase PrpC|nr:Stp1/IreP family PP2C-type Ser/Thr phosphatase [Candidatus Saccharimonadales bacterium]
MTLLVEVAGKTDVGCVRANNEDNFGYDSRCGIYVVCDGMGGQAAGEVASKLGVDVVLNYFREAAESGGYAQVGEPLEGLSEGGQALASAIRLANRTIHETGQEQASRAGMGSTMVAVLIRDQVLSIANVGDSRIYMVRHGSIQQLTQDHSLVMEQVRRGYITLEQAAKSEMQNIILRALGSEDTVEADVEDLVLLPGDLLLMSSDGLTKYLRDDDLLTIVASTASLERVCDLLIAAAKQRGGDDNITCLLMKAVNPPWYKRILRGMAPGGRKWRNSI